MKAEIESQATPRGVDRELGDALRDVLAVLLARGQVETARLVVRWVDRGVAAGVFAPEADCDELKLSRDRAEALATMLAIQLHHGHTAAALDVVDQAAAAVREGQQPLPRGPAALALGVYQVFDEWIANKIYERGIETIGDLVRHRPETIAAIPNIGPKALARILRIVKGLGVDERIDAIPVSKPFVSRAKRPRGPRKVR